MAGIVSGVNVITEFETPESASYSGYIDYMNKEQGKQEQYKEYNDYLAKTDSLFTMEKDNLSENEIKELKSLFEKAQENGSVLWKTVISFDNRWLEQNGIYDMKSDILNETKMREAIRKGIDAMLNNEGLQYAFWSAGIHYDTDNIHVHVATVEPIPMRQKKTYKQYEVSRNEKNKLVHKKPVLNGKGEQVVKEEYVGVFKASSIKLCKSAVANEIMQQRDVTLEINSIIRDQILKNKANISFRMDPKLQEQFFKVYEMLPDCPKNMWKYGQNIMKPIRSEIDELSDLYLSVYHGEEMKRIKELLKIQAARYMAAYGDTGKDYGIGKMEDLHKRLGNIILAEMRTFALEEKENEQEKFDGKEIEEVLPVETEEIEEVLPVETEEIEDASLEEAVYSKWTKEYKEARKSFYGSALKEPDEERGVWLYEQEAEKGNVLALFDLAEIYKNGNTEEKEKSAVYYQRAVKGWKVLAEKENLTNHQKGTILYKLGKCYDRGYGVEQDADQAKKYYQSAESKGNNYAAYSLGNIFYYQEKDHETAYEHYRKGVSDQYRKNPFGDYQFAVLSEKGIGRKEGEVQAEQYFKQALNGFIKLDKDINDPKLEYRMGYMFYQGIGTEQDTEKALEYLKKATVKGHTYAEWMIGKIYLERGEKEDGINWLKKAAEHEAAQQESGCAQYYLGKMYLLGEDTERNIEEAVKWFEKASENGNQYAQYQLGKIYLTGINGNQNMKKALEWLKKSAEQNNQYAQYMLGKIYMNGVGVEKNLQEAVKWFEKSAEQENGCAQYYLGKMYLLGEDTERDIEEAVKWFEKASENGNQYAQYQLGKIYLTGINGNQNMKKALEWLKKSAEQNNQYAQYMLGKIYMNGVGVEKNLQEAVKWFEKSAEQENGYAQYYLGKIYLQSRDMEKAGEWIGRAIRNRNEAAIHLYVNEATKLGKISVGKEFEKVKRNFNKSMNQFIKSLRKDYEAWKNIMEHDRMLEKELNVSSTEELIV